MLVAVIADGDIVPFRLGDVLVEVGANGDLGRGSGRGMVLGGVALDGGGDGVDVGGVSDRASGDEGDSGGDRDQEGGELHDEGVVDDFC